MRIELCFEPVDPKGTRSAEINRNLQTAQPPCFANVSFNMCSHVVLIYVDFRDRRGTHKPFFRMAQEGPPGRSPTPKMALDPIPEGNDP